MTGYTGFSSNVDEQEGNYLVIHCEDEDADTITVELVGGVKGPVQLDEDGIIIIRVTSTSQSVRVVSTGDSGTKTKTYSLSGITLGV